MERPCFTASVGVACYSCEREADEPISAVKIVGSSDSLPYVVRVFIRANS